ncbi:MAG: DUF4215 domain-containing protein [Myxococcota bacterium]
MTYRIALLAPLVLCACELGRPHAMVRVTDPSGLAENAAWISILNGDGEVLEERIRDGFPIELLVRGASEGIRQVRIEASNLDGRVLGRGNIEAFLSRVTEATRVVALGTPCTTDAECTDSLFCNGEERCRAGVCASEPDPCPASPVSCVNVACVERNGEGEPGCIVTAEHEVCGSTNINGDEVQQFCDPLQGCRVGTPCDVDAECDDGQLCNGSESCVANHCFPGVAPDVNDENPCTLDACSEEAGGRIHFADPNAQGLSCGTGLVCNGSECIDSVCGDGFVDERTEECEDGNANPNDGCDACRTNRWQSSLLTSASALNALTDVFSDVAGIAVDRGGYVYLSDRVRSVVWRIDLNNGNTATVYAGTGRQESTGDDGPAVAASILPGRLTLDSAANLYVEDGLRIRRIDANTRQIETVYGTGVRGNTTFGLAARSQPMRSLVSMAADGEALYATTSQGIVRVDVVSNQGTLLSGIAAQITIGADGVLYGSTSSEPLSRIDREEGTFSPVPLNGYFGTDDDYGVFGPNDLATGADGLLYVVNSSQHLIRIDPATRTASIATYTEFSIPGDRPNANALVETVYGTALGDGTVLVVGHVDFTMSNGVVYQVSAPGQHVPFFGTDSTVDLLDGRRGTTLSNYGDLLIEHHAVGDEVSYVSLQHRSTTDLAQFYAVDHATGILDALPIGPLPPIESMAIASGNLLVSTKATATTADSLFIYEPESQQWDEYAPVKSVTSNGTTAFGWVGEQLFAIGNDGQLTAHGPESPAGVGFRDVRVAESGDIFWLEGDSIRRLPIVGGAPVTDSFFNTNNGIRLLGLYGPNQDPLVQFSSDIVLVNRNGNFNSNDSDAYWRSLQLNLSNGNFSIEAGPRYAAALAEARLPSDPILVVYDLSNRNLAGETLMSGPYHPFGDGRLAQARGESPAALLSLSDEQWLIADGGSAVRLLDERERTLLTVAGNQQGFETSFQVQTRRLGAVRGLALAGGRLFVSDSANHQLLELSGWSSSDQVTLLAGDADGSAGYADGNSDTLFREPAGLAVSPGGTHLYVADSGNHVVRRVDLSDSSTSTVVGQPGIRGYFVDGSDAGPALFHSPTALAFGPEDVLYIADRDNHRVRMLRSDGTLETVLGNGEPASTGTGRPGREFGVASPAGLWVDPFGNLFVTGLDRIRLVAAGDDGMATGDDPVLTVFDANRALPNIGIRCLSAIAASPGAPGRLLITDACTGSVIALDRLAQ